MSASHTQEAYRWEAVNTRGTNRWEVRPVHSDGAGYGAFTVGMSERQARLIAASPDLLHAAIRARASLAAAVIHAAGGLFDADSVGQHEVVGMLDAAIAKAIGAGEVARG